MNGVVFSSEWSGYVVMLAERERERKKPGKSQRSKMAAERNLTQISFIFSPLSGTALQGKLICMQLSSD